MQASLGVLQSFSQSRALSAPLATPTGAIAPGSEAFLETLRQRNAVLDWLFYDIGVVTHDEAASISPWLAAEGAILVVPPTAKGNVSLCSSIDAFVAEYKRVDTLAVAGVGSSALGSAAFARNVADAIDKPVAAVVSGYGLADLITEALGGFFLFGTTNSLRHNFEWLDRLRESGAVADPGTGSTDSTNYALPQRSKDTRTVAALLSHDALSLRTLIGHSKGNLVISEALFGLSTTARPKFLKIAPELLIVTVSAKIAMPPQCGKIVDILGKIDGFGLLNSRLDLETEVAVPLAWHHTNTQLPLHLPVTATLRCVPELAA
ncbi:hypothetical protein [Noviherbaspirillum sedimenti]|nr:hypothetical protein [Noviherbaspirillum sedimenti]